VYQSKVILKFPQSESHFGIPGTWPPPLVQCDVCFSGLNVLLFKKKKKNRKKKEGLARGKWVVFITNKSGLTSVFRLREKGSVSTEMHWRARPHLDSIEHADGLSIKQLVGECISQLQRASGEELMFTFN
jgi:hypothetical protein